jgi:hypothetical protein
LYKKRWGFHLACVKEPATTKKDPKTYLKASAFETAAFTPCVEAHFQPHLLIAYQVDIQGVFGSLLRLKPTIIWGEL